MANGSLSAWLCLKKARTGESGHVVVKKETPSEPSSDSASAPAAPSVTSSLPTAASETLSGDKSRYNKFHFRIKKTSAEVQEVYKKLKKDGTAEELDEFMNGIASMKGTLNEDFLARFRVHRKVEGSTTTSGWVSWKKTCKDEEPEVLLEKIKHGTTQAKRDPDLPADSTIPYPRNQILHMRRTEHQTKEETEDSGQLKEHVEINPESHQAFLHEFAHTKAMAKKKIPDSAGASATPCSGSTASNPDSEAPLDATTKTAVTNLRKCHTAWDKCKREWDATVASSKINQNTEGCKPERDLEKMVADGSAEDMKIQKLEQHVLQGERFSQDQIQESAELCTKLTDFMKSGNKKAVGLKFLMKMK